MNKTHSKHMHVYAVVSFDFPVNPEHPENTTSIVKVFSSQQSAKQEVRRWSKVNAVKRCPYHVWTTRFLSDEQVSEMN